MRELVEELKRLQKIHCRNCDADYDACRKCAFHNAANSLLAAALNVPKLEVYAVPPQIHAVQSERSR